MRARSTGALTFGLALVVGLASVALAYTETVADDFSSGGYGGSTGSIAWAGNWEEEGESNGPGTGAVQVKSASICGGSCLTIERLLSLGISDAGAMRPIDLSSATSATLTYHVYFPAGLLGRAVVDAQVDGAWVPLESHSAGTEEIVTVGLPVGDTVVVRFRVTDLGIGTRVHFDDVVVEIEMPDPTTTTTTTTTTTITPIRSTTTSTTGSTTTSTLHSTTTTTQPGPGSRTTISHPVGESTTTTFRRGSTTTTTGPTDEAETRTTARRNPDGSPIEVTTTTGWDDGSTEDGDTPTVTDDAEADPDTAAVVRNLNPGLIKGSDLQAQENLLVIFGLTAEDIRLDILSSAVLGLVLGWASLKRLD